MNNRKRLPQSLETMPTDIVTSSISSFLDYGSIINTAKSSVRLHGFFKPRLGATALLDYVINADYRKAEGLIHIDPLLMFKSVRDPRRCDIYLMPEEKEPRDSDNTHLRLYNIDGVFVYYINSAEYKF